MNRKSLNQKKGQKAIIFFLKRVSEEMERGRDSKGDKKKRKTKQKVYFLFF